MEFPNRRHVLPLFAVLALLMAATRYAHFGAADRLPDASLAVFLLGGLCLRRPAWFAVLLAEAVLLDLATPGGAALCLSPAYVFLLPTYGLLWGCGLLGRRLPLLARSLLPAAGLVLAGVAGAFLVSNAGYWLLSGHAGGMGVAQYAVTVGAYFPAYLGSAVLYLGLAALVAAAAVSLAGHRVHRAG